MKKSWRPEGWESRYNIRAVVNGIEHRAPTADLMSRAFEEGADAMLENLLKRGAKTQMMPNTSNPEYCYWSGPVYIPKGRCLIKGTLIFIPDDEEI